VACATFPYLNILFNGFVYDDDAQVVQNPYVRSFQYLKEIFTTNVWSFNGVTVSNYYRPMMTFGYLVCYQLFGMRAYGFHLVSLLLHVLVVCLVFVLTERLTGDRVWASVAGALFALHPIHTESVAWIAAVTDLELTFFYLLAFRFFLAVAKPGGRRSERMLAAMVFAFIPALLSKEQAMTLPALATVYEHFYRADRCETSTPQKLARYGLLWLVGLAYLLFRIHFLGALVPEEKFHQVTSQQIVLSAITLVGQYVWKLLWPVRLCAFYVFHPSTSPFDLRVLASLLVLLALAALFLVCWRSRERNVRFASFAILWFFATLAPILNARWVGENVFTERYLYLPSVGVAWLVGLGASKLWSRAAARPAQQRTLVLAGIGLGALFAARIVIRDRDWNNDIALYTQTLDVSPDASVIQNWLGWDYFSQGDWDKAESAWRGVLARNPNSISALNNLGTVARLRKQYAQAGVLYQRAIELDPSAPGPHFGMGQLLMEEGRLREAEEQLRAGIRIHPDVTVYDYLGQIHVSQGSSEEAERDFRAALRLDESDSNAHFGLGYLYQAAGRTSEALRQYQAALVSDPTNAKVVAAIQGLRRQSAGAAP
jgi:tetratricopeptide (TPR) repeat protein